jgi:hypothetical protein
VEKSINAWNNKPVCCRLQDERRYSKGILSTDEVFSTNNPNVFIMDHLVLLEPVKVLEGENIHNVNAKTKLISIFVFLPFSY